MIYLICAQDSKDRIAEVSKPSDLDSSFWAYVLNLTKNRNFLYSHNLYSKLTKEVLPNRVNIVFSTDKNQKGKPITNAIVCDSIKQILTTYNGNVDDVFILGDKLLIEYFADHADYIILCKTNKIGFVMQTMHDTIDFANFRKISSQEDEDLNLTYFVRMPEMVR